VIITVEQTMNKIEECENLLKEWEAKAYKSIKHKLAIKAKMEADVMLGISLALQIIKRSSATTIQTDTEPCENCVEYQKLKGTERWLIHCPTCGRLLDR